VRRVYFCGCVLQDGRLELDPLRRLQLVQLCEERRDVVVFRIGIHQPSRTLYDCIRCLRWQGMDTGDRCVSAVQPPQDDINEIIHRDRLRNDLYCVGWGVKLYSLTHTP